MKKLISTDYNEESHYGLIYGVSGPGKLTYFIDLN